MGRSDLHYWEAVRIGWSLLWRTAGSFLVLLFLANLLLLLLLPELTRSGPSLAALVLPVTLAAIVEAFVVMPLVVRALAVTPSSGFRLGSGQSQAMEPPLRSTEPFTRRTGHETEDMPRDDRHGARVESRGERRASARIP